MPIVTACESPSLWLCGGHSYHANRSKEIKVLSIRGFRLALEERPLSKLLKTDTNFNKIEILISDPDSPFLKKRANDFADSGITYTSASGYKNDNKQVLDKIHDLRKKNSKIDLYIHTQPESFRLLFTDEYLYLSFFPKGKTASESRVFKIACYTELYEAFLEHYNWVKCCNSQEYFPQTKPMNYTAIVTPEEASLHLEDPTWVFIDCRFSLSDPNIGFSQYRKEHIKDALYADLNKNMSGEIIHGTTGRHPLPQKEKLISLFSQYGIDSHVQVVVYDDCSGSMAASRLWWLLKWAGHDAVAVLDGGFKYWKLLGFPCSKAVEKKRVRYMSPSFRDEFIFNTSDIVRAIKNKTCYLLDSRSLDRFKGKNETIDPIAGHIPGAISVPFVENLDENGKFKPLDILKERFQKLVQDKCPEQIIFYCGSGVTATHNILAFFACGMGMPRLYVGSWSEWTTNPERPVEKG